MGTFMFFYTALLLFLCTASAFMPLGAFFVSRMRAFLATFSASIFYILDLALIFEGEYFWVGTTYPEGFFWAIDYPFVKTFLALGLLTSIWLAILFYLEEESDWSKWILPAGFLIASIIVILLLPDGSFRQWSFYTLRQVFLFICIAFCFHRYRTGKKLYRLKLGRVMTFLILALTLTILVLIEDTWIILIADPTKLDPTFPLYLSERNFSESIFALLFTFVVMVAAWKTLNIHRNAVPNPETGSSWQRKEVIMPEFVARYGLTAREQEVLEAILADKSNKEIASEFQVSIGTVKSHTHNLYSKAGVSRREDLTVLFWQN